MVVFPHSYDAGMSSDESNFYLTNDLSVTLEGKEFYSKKWNEQVERNFV